MIQHRMMNEHLTAAFWHGAETHVASAPGESAEGLATWMKQAHGRQGWCLFQTSGTEGRRKWVALTKNAMLVSARAVNAHFAVTTADRWLLALPLWHVGGFGILARAFAVDVPVETMSGRWDAKAFAFKAEETGATLTSLVPTQVFDLVSAGIAAPKSLRVVLVGGGALSQQVRQAALRLGWPVRTTYGMTETASQVASEVAEGGRMEVLPIWEPETNAEGVLTIRGPALAKGYASHEGSEWRWEPIESEKGLRTRDRVELAREGGRCFLRFTGRESGIIKILGELVALGPIQERLEALRLGLQIIAGDAVVCDLPDARAGSRLVLAVSGMPAADAARLREALNLHLRAFEQIQTVVELAQIPRGDLGKVQLEELRSLLA
jgi:O-succinylbenzoic acid--CoA ligase